MADEALIVGASRGIGLALARELSARGWRVTGTRRGDAPALEAVPGVAVETVDIADAASAEAFAARMDGRTFQLVLLNAGVYGPRDATAATATPELLLTLMTVNALAPIRLARRLLPAVERGGTLAFMSSRMGSVAGNTTGGGELYRASKAALNSLARSLAAGEEARGLDILTLHPGWVRTDMGGKDAPLGVEESARGLADVVERRRGPGHRFLDHAGETIPW